MSTVTLTGAGAIAYYNALVGEKDAVDDFTDMLVEIDLETLEPTIYIKEKHEYVNYENLRDNGHTSGVERR